MCRVEVMFDDQCDVLWTLPKGVEPIPLFQTTSYNIDGDCLDLIGGVHGRTFHFQVGPVIVKQFIKYILSRVGFVSTACVGGACRQG